MVRTGETRRQDGRGRGLTDVDPSALVASSQKYDLSARVGGEKKGV